MHEPSQAVARVTHLEAFEKSPAQVTKEAFELLILRRLRDSPARVTHLEAFERSPAQVTHLEAF